MEPDAVTHSFEMVRAALVFEVVDAALDVEMMPVGLRVEVMSAVLVCKNPGSLVEVVSEMEEDAVTHSFEAVYGALGVEAIPAPLVVEGKKTAALHVHKKPESLAKKHHR